MSKCHINLFNCNFILLKSLRQHIQPRRPGIVLLFFTSRNPNQNLRNQDVIVLTIDELKLILVWSLDLNNYS